ncbi:MAG: PaaI family thioesterase [Phascolarctobacterium faecium]
MNLLKIEIDEIHCGGATVKMPIDFDIHTNHSWCTVVLAALADAVMGITGASVGEVVQTLSFNINYQQSPGTGTAIVKSQVKHHGQTTMVIMAEMIDEQNNLLAAITTTMFIAGHFNEIPREW